MREVDRTFSVNRAQDCISNKHQIIARNADQNSSKEIRSVRLAASGFSQIMLDQTLGPLFHQPLLTVVTASPVARHFLLRIRSVLHAVDKYPD